MSVAIRSANTRRQPRAAPAQTSPQPMQSPSPLSRVNSRQQTHPARSHRASLPRFERAHLGKVAIGQGGRAGERAGKWPGGRMGQRHTMACLMRVPAVRMLSRVRATAPRGDGTRILKRRHGAASRMERLRRNGVLGPCLTYITDTCHACPRSRGQVVARCVQRTVRPCAASWGRSAQH